MDKAVARIICVEIWPKAVLIFGVMLIDGTTAVSLVSLLHLKHTTLMSPLTFPDLTPSTGCLIYKVDFADDNGITLIILWIAGKSIDHVAYAKSEHRLHHFS
jgi:hypothetical protein